MTRDPQITFDQSDIERWFRSHHGTDRWTTLYQSGRGAETGIGLYSCLIPPKKRTRSLKNPGWDLSIPGGGPGFSQEWRENETITTYHRTNGYNRIEPIVIVRDFNHGRPSYAEISEELRLLFNLYEDRQSGLLYEANEDGTETEVVKVAHERVDIRTSLLRRYIAARQMALVLQIDSDVWLRLTEGESAPILPDERRHKDRELCFHFYAGMVSSVRPFSRFLGKKIILPPDRSECGIWPFEDPKQFLDFIIGEDERGRPIEHTCDPDQLSNYFGLNLGAPHYLTPVFFKREVLHKYYENNDRYEVQDGGIRCSGLWILRVDNNHDEHVMVFLGDLGRDIPTGEQRHWRSYNILPEDRKISVTEFRRSILGEWHDAEHIEHRFKRAYSSTTEAWLGAFGWPLFKDLHPDDRHVLSSLHLPLTNTVNEFDSQVLDLAKLMVDSLNEEQIAASVNGPNAKGDKGIAKLERLLTQWHYPFVSHDAALLRTIQGVRSRGIAHRKGSNYDLTQAGLDPNDLHASFRSLLERSTTMLSELEAFANRQRGIGQRSELD